MSEVNIRVNHSVKMIYYSIIQFQPLLTSTTYQNSIYDRNTDLHKIGELQPYDGSLLGKSPTRSHKSWHGVNFSTFIFPLQKAIHIRYTVVDWCKGLLEHMTKMFLFPTGSTF